ncbi:unnamed protein product [Linum tenue]|uniref:Wound-responsive family protein n=3 Tax=Linum tenue TaxID=586396 RepID=A0AAV0GSU1_9ROSI|nr:unnamed protein product [Linum tenue]
MSSAAAASKAWMVAASIGAVEALKDQGVCRWNHAMRSIHHHANSKLRSLVSHPARRNLSSSSSSASDGEMASIGGAARKTEASFDRVMGLGCFGPTTTRF